MVFFIALLWSAGFLPAHAKTISFPPGFTWCVATAAHQIEGSNFLSDHFQWELEPDRVISRAFVGELISAGAAPLCPIVASSFNPDPEGNHTLRFSQPNGTVKMCEYSGRATDHWNRVQEDVGLLKRLSVGQYRFSVEWAKIEPKPDVFDEAVLDHYRAEVNSLRQAGIEPLVTLFHFTLPQWLRARGGWEAPEAPELFERFTRKVYSALGASVTTWFTLNEPIVHIFAGYAAGVLPPGIRDISRIGKPLTGLVRAHGRAYRALHQMADASGRSVKVGVAHHLRVFEPYQRLNPLDQMAAKWSDEIFNWAFVTALETGKLSVHLPMVIWMDQDIPEARRSQDFLGVNYYSRDLIHMNPLAKEKIQPILDPLAIQEKRVTDMNWEIYPDGLRQTLKTAHQKVKSSSGRSIPVFVSENGIADARDERRQKFLEQHLVALRAAVDEGVPVTGFCHWTLIDNFEWNSGYFPKFGFFAMDPRTFERIERPSARWFSKTAETGRFELSP